MISIIIVAVFFIGAAFFSGSEIGLISLDKHRLKHESSKSTSKKRLYDFVTNPDKVLGTTLIGTNISIIIVSSVFTAFMIKQDVMSKTLATLLLSGVLLIFAEIIPKILIRNTCNTSIPKFFFLIRFFSFLFHPLIWVLSKINNAFFKLFKIDKESSTHLFTKDDLSYLLEEAEKDGHVKKDEHDLIEEVLDFRELTVKNIMIPRTNIVGVKSDTPIKDVISLMKEVGFTRFPVYSVDVDHIDGMLIIHDLLEVEDLSLPAEKFMREAYFVPEIMKATTLLKKMQKNKTPIVVVVDEYGGTAGIISVEDLLEELVGEIEDEYDAQENDISKVDDTTFLVNGEVEIERLIEDYHIELYEGDYETLAGMLIEKFERIPRYNEKLLIKNYEFTIKQVTAKKIEKVMIKILPLQEESD